MALVLGTNCGFVTTAPTSDPAETAWTISTTAQTLKDTSPAGDNRIIEIGWYCGNATQEADTEVGIYSDSGTNHPDDLLASQTFAKGTDAGWKRVTGLNISISAETIYWLAAQCDTTATATKFDVKASGSDFWEYKTSQTSLPDPWGSGTQFAYLNAIYALWEEAPTGFTRKIKIAGTFVDKPIKEKKAGTFQDKPISIKVGGTFQDA